jgi:sugar phosphate isomerase/epimerase
MESAKKERGGVPDGLPVLYPTWFLPEGKPLECARVVYEAGFDGASYMLGTLDDPRRLDLLTAGEADELRSGLLEMQLDRSLHVGTHMYLQAEADDAAAAALLQDHLTKAVRALSADGLPPVKVTFDPPVRWRLRQARLLVGLAEQVLTFAAGLDGGCGVRVGLENWPFAFIGTPEALAEVLAGVPEEVGVLLDTGHAHIALTQGWCRQQTAAEFVRALPRRVVEVHCHDNHGEADEHLPPGAGTADIAGMLAALRGQGYAGPITIECNLTVDGHLSRDSLHFSIA